MSDYILAQRSLRTLQDAYYNKQKLLITIIIKDRESYLQYINESEFNTIVGKVIEKDLILGGHYE
jgi:hypothetical protein